MRDIKKNYYALYAFLKRNNLIQDAKKLIPNHIDTKSYDEKIKEVNNLVSNNKYLDEVYREGLPLFYFMRHAKLKDYLKTKLIDRGTHSGGSKNM